MAGGQNIQRAGDLFQRLIGLEVRGENEDSATKNFFSQDTAFPKPLDQFVAQGQPAKRELWEAISGGRGASLLREMRTAAASTDASAAKPPIDDAETLAALKDLLAALDGKATCKATDLASALSAVFNGRSKANRDFILAELKKIFGDLSATQKDDGTWEIKQGDNVLADADISIDPAKIAIVKGDFETLQTIFRIQDLLAFLTDNPADGFTLKDLAEKILPLLATDPMLGSIDGAIDRKAFLTALAELLTIQSSTSAGDTSSASLEISDEEPPNLRLVLGDKTLTLTLKTEEGHYLVDASDPASVPADKISVDAEAKSRISLVQSFFTDLGKKTKIEMEDLFKHWFPTFDGPALEGFLATLKDSGEFHPYWLYLVIKDLQSKGDPGKTAATKIVEYILTNIPADSPLARFRLESTTSDKTAQIDGAIGLIKEKFSDINASTDEGRAALESAVADFKDVKIASDKVDGFKTLLRGEAAAVSVESKLAATEATLTEAKTLLATTDEASKTKRERLATALGHGTDVAAAKTAVEYLEKKITEAKAKPAGSSDRSTAIGALGEDELYKKVAGDGFSVAEATKSDTERGQALLAKIQEFEGRKAKLTPQQIEDYYKELGTTAADFEALKTSLTEAGIKATDGEKETAFTAALSGKADLATKIRNTSLPEPPPEATERGGRPSTAGAAGAAGAGNLGSTPSSGITSSVRDRIISTPQGLQTNDFEFVTIPLTADGKLATSKENFSAQGMLIRPKAGGAGIILVPVYDKDGEGKPVFKGIRRIPVTFGANGAPTLGEGALIEGPFAIQLQNRDASGLGPILWWEPEKNYLTLVSNDESFASSRPSPQGFSPFGQPMDGGGSYIEGSAASRTNQTFELTSSGEWKTSPDPAHRLRPLGGGFFSGEDTGRADRAESLVKFLGSLQRSGGLAKNPSMFGRVMEMLPELRGLVNEATTLPPGVTREQVQKQIDEVAESISNYAASSQGLGQAQAAYDAIQDKTSEAAKAAKATLDAAKTRFQDADAKIKEADAKLAFLQSIADLGMQELRRKAGKRAKDRIDLDALIAQWLAGGISFEYLLLMVMVVLLEGGDEEIVQTIKEMNRISKAQKNLRPEDMGVSGGLMQSLQTDSAIAQTRLQNLIGARSRLIETINNAQKSHADALANSVRRMV